MLRIITQLTDLRAELRRICDRTDSGEMSEQQATVEAILRRVAKEGDRALIEYTAQFDHIDLTPETLRVKGDELDAAYQQVSKELLDAIRLAKQQIEAFHRQRVPKSWVQFGEDGIVLGKRYTAVDAAGLYVPGDGLPIRVRC